MQYMGGTCTQTPPTSVLCTCDAPFAVDISTGLCTGCMPGYVRRSAACITIDAACGSDPHVDRAITTALSACTCALGFIRIGEKCVLVAPPVPGPGRGPGACGRGGTWSPPVGCVCGRGYLTYSQQPGLTCDTCGGGFVFNGTGCSAATGSETTLDCAGLNEVPASGACGCALGFIRSSAGTCDTCAPGFAGPACLPCPPGPGACVAQDFPPWHVFRTNPVSVCFPWCTAMGGTCGTPGVPCDCPGNRTGYECTGCTTGFWATPQTCVACSPDEVYSSASGGCRVVTAEDAGSAASTTLGGTVRRPVSNSFEPAPTVDVSWVYTAFRDAVGTSAASYYAPVGVFDAAVLAVVGLNLCLVSFRVGEACARRAAGFEHIDTPEQAAAAFK